jgi:putative ABC transport system substrate-binding protein
MRRRLVLASAAVAIASPATARAQQKEMPVVGWLSTARPAAVQPALAAFRQALGEAGYVEGQNIAIEYRWTEGRYDLLPAMAAELAGRGVDAIVAVSIPAAQAAKAASRTIPVIFLGGSDPVRAGLVESLARPGGNVTGVSALGTALHAKRLELLREIVPSAAAIAVLMNPNNPDAERWMRDLEEVGRSAPVQHPILKAGSAGELEDAFSSLAQGQVGALIVDGDPFFLTLRDQVVALAARHRVPTMYSYPEFARAGGLMSYGGTTAAVFRQVGNYTARILKGAKPANLPVVQPTGFQLAVNLRTAQILGITMPPSIFARADEVIE